jgi:hypothetical protein
MTATVQSRQVQLEQHKAQGRTDPLDLVGLDLAFTHPGLSKFCAGGSLQDTSFEVGAITRWRLGRPTSTRGGTAQFEGNIDGILLITGGCR